MPEQEEKSSIREPAARKLPFRLQTQVFMPRKIHMNKYQ